MPSYWVRAAYSRICVVAGSSSPTASMLVTHLIATQPYPVRHDEADGKPAIAGQWRTVHPRRQEGSCSLERVSREDPARAGH